MDKLKIIQRLIDQLVPIECKQRENALGVPETLDEDYRTFLSICNGGYTKDNFFHFLGLSGPPQHDVIHWNTPEAWKKWFQPSDSWFFFAEDIWGDQYFFTTGRRKVLRTLWIHDGKSTLDSWSFVDFIDGVVFGDSNDGLKALARRFFQETGEHYEPFKHISYKIPLCLGGSETEISNMELSDSLINLRFAGQVTTQVKKLAPGTRIVDVQMNRDSGELRLIPETPAGEPHSRPSP